MIRKIGIIAEDISDVEVLKILGRKISGKAVNSSHFVGKGCGPLKRKTPGWCQSLSTKGCDFILLVHDRDRNNAGTLRSQLESILKNAPQSEKIVVIPEEELEAWLLSDSNAINLALKLDGKFKQVNHPETINSPKEFIRDHVYKVSNKGKNYVNSVHNKIIAEFIDTNLISQRCPSFQKFAEIFEKPKKPTTSKK